MYNINRQYTPLQPKKERAGENESSECRVYFNLCSGLEGAYYELEEEGKP